MRTSKTTSFIAHTRMTRHFESIVAIWLLAGAAGCETDAGTDALENETFSLQVGEEGDTIDVNFSENDSRYFVACTDYLTVYKVEDGVRKEAVGSGFQADDHWEGYYLDGVFVMPGFDEGCDVLSCTALNEWSHAVSIVDYHLQGTRALTEEEKAAVAAIAWDGYTVVEEVNEYTTSIYSGEVEVVLSYYGDDTCNGYEESTETATQRITIP